MTRGYYPLAIGVLATALLAGCASAVKRPVLYPNAHYGQVGKVAAEGDVDECVDLANDTGVKARDGQVAKGTAAGAAVGAASAGAWGVIRGDAGSRAAAGAAAGAAGSATRGALNARDPDPIYRRFVEKCLRDEGYEVIGWQ